MANWRTPRFQLAVQELPEGVTLVAVGTLDRSARAALLHWARTNVGPPSGTLTIDLAALDSCDWSGIAALLNVRAAAISAGWQFEIVNAPPHVGMIMRAVELERITWPTLSPAASRRRPCIPERDVCRCA